jgi:hypothetical protein
MAEYVWQLGIDWNAIQTGGVGYLRGGLLKKVNGGPDVPMAGTNPVQTGDQITFRIFDVTSSTPPVPPPVRHVSTIGFFGIDSLAAVKDQQLDQPLDNPHPTIASSSMALGQSSIFGNAHCSWDLQPVTVTASPARFLLTVYLQAVGLDGNIRLFNHDPEMVVGGTGG